MVGFAIFGLEGLGFGGAAFEDAEGFAGGGDFDRFGGGGLGGELAGERAAGVEGATGGRVRGGGDFAVEDDAFFAGAGVRLGDGRE